MTTTIGHMMRNKLETIEEMASAQDAANKMKDKNVSSLVVVDGKDKPQGLVTERDLVRKVCINDLHTSMVKNKEIMTCPLITVNSDSPSSVAANLLRRSTVECIPDWLYKIIIPY
jgi:signal-transduction protein with cAMP-binding, CBS, and nucleotidyltransferase domain